MEKEPTGESGIFHEIIQAVEKNVPAENRELLYDDLLNVFEDYDIDIYVDDCYGESEALDNIIDKRYYSDELYDDIVEDEDFGEE